MTINTQKLRERIDAAIKRITSGSAPMRVPADQTDPDLVLADAKIALDAQTAEIARLRSRIAELRVAVQGLLNCPSCIYCDGYQDAEHKARTALQEKSHD